MAAIKLKVLVADDSAAIHHIFHDMALHSPIPFEIVRANNGRECMEILERGGINLAFIDIDMPEMSGLDAVGAVRLEGIKTFVTMMSSISSAPRLQMARSLKVYDYLAKPFAPEDVFRILMTYCRITQPTRALIVDDSTTVRKLVERIMNASLFNIEFEHAGSGEAALEMCENEEYDVIILDCNMPGLDGLETLERMLEYDPDVKVVMISGERNAEKTRWALDRGAFAFLQKPFVGGDIDRVLHSIFGLKLPELAAQQPAKSLSAARAS
jgi:DNA-binding NtrC family response regulator